MLTEVRTKNLLMRVVAQLSVELRRQTPLSRGRGCGGGGGKKRGVCGGGFILSRLYIIDYLAREHVYGVQLRVVIFHASVGDSSRHVVVVVVVVVGGGGGGGVVEVVQSQRLIGLLMLLLRHRIHIRLGTEEEILLLLERQFENELLHTSEVDVHDITLLLLCPLKISTLFLKKNKNSYSQHATFLWVALNVFSFDHFEVVEKNLLGQQRLLFETEDIRIFRSEMAFKLFRIRTNKPM